MADLSIQDRPSPPSRKIWSPGGKAAQRLQLFHESRGLSTTLSNPAHARSLLTYTDRRRLADIASTYARAAAVTQSSGPPWKSIGPGTVTNGQTYGTSRIIVSGRIASIGVDPSNSAHILAGSAAGGVWESRDAGNSWAPRTDNMPTLTVGAVAFDSSKPANVYVGTGEGNFYAPLGAGLLASADGGSHWSILASDVFSGQGFYRLIVHPDDGKRLFGATTGGLFESKDAGVTWEARRPTTTWDISLHLASGTAELLAACTDGLQQSADGTNWNAVALPGAPDTLSRMAVAHSPSNGEIAFVFAAGPPCIAIPDDPNPSHQMPTPYLWRRGSDGTYLPIPLPAGLNTTQAAYDWYVAVSPDNENQIYIGAIDLIRGDFDGAVWNWTNLSTKASGDSIHPDQHAIAFDARNANIIYAGNDGGLFQSPDRGITWNSLNRGLGITEIEYLAQDLGSSNWLLAGTQDNGTIRFSGSGTWEHVADGDGGFCAVDSDNPSTVFHTFYYMGIERSLAKGDFGSFAEIGPTVPNGYQCLFYSPFTACGSTSASRPKCFCFERLRH